MKNRRRPVLQCTIGLLTLMVLAVTAPGWTASPIPRPQWSLDTDEAFDASSIAAYAGNHAAIYAHIDASLDRHVGQLQRWVRQRSISAQNDGIQAMAQLVRDDLSALGFAESELVPTDGHPGVWGYYDAGAATTLMVYFMYDVQPVNPQDWRTPPFEGNLVDHTHGKVLMARGATNQKGPQRAFLNALASIIAVNGKLPVNIMLTAEGEEELGSVHYPQIVDRYEDRLRTADGAFFPFNSQAPDGRMTMNLGVKGIIYFELQASGNEHGGPVNNEIHGSYKALVDAPVWRLVQALSTLTSADGNTITVPGYYDDIRPPTLEEQRLINGMVPDWNETQLRASLGVERWIDGRSGVDALLDYLYQPTMNIDGLWGGYTGEGVKTILPHKATAKVDSRLPPGIDPHEALAKIRAHLDAKGYADIVMRELSAYPAAQTTVEAPLVRAAIGVINKYGEPPLVRPRVAGSAPFYQFTERLGLPLVFAGLGHGSGAHAPDEYMLIEPGPNTRAAGLADLEKAYVDLLFALAGQ